MTADANQSPRQQFSMADISSKQTTNRRALARGRIVLGAAAFDALVSGTLPKGDALGMAEIAGIMGAKQTAQLLPLCHPISLSRAAIMLQPDEPSHAVIAYCLCEISEKTGVEMEALTGLNIALLTLWDLCKPINADLLIDDISLLYKSGGKRGQWINPAGLDAMAVDLLGVDIKPDVRADEHSVDN